MKIAIIYILIGWIVAAIGYFWIGSNVSFIEHIFFAGGLVQMMCFTVHAIGCILFDGKN